MADTMCVTICYARLHRTLWSFDVDLKHLISDAYPCVVLDEVNTFPPGASNFNAFAMYEVLID